MQIQIQNRSRVTAQSVLHSSALAADDGFPTEITEVRFLIKENVSILQSTWRGSLKQKQYVWRMVTFELRHTKACISLMLHLLSRSFSDHHLGYAWWLKFEISKRENIREHLYTYYNFITTPVGRGPGFYPFRQHQWRTEKINKASKKKLFSIWNW